MRKKHFWLMSMAVLSAFLTFSCRNASVSDTPVEDTPVFPLGFIPSAFEADTFRVKSGETLSLLFAKLGLSQKDAYDLVQAADSVFPAKNLRSGKTCIAFRDSSALQYLVYEQDKISSVVFRCTPPFEAWACEKEVVTSQRFADVTINTSLWVDMKNAGVSPLLILSLSDVYAWTVDFFGLQQGDRFRVVYDEKSVEDEVIAVDTIRTAQFIRGTDTLSCFMFNQGDGGNIYWNGKGESMRKAFLKAPLHFSRISSGFSYARKHPITRKVQPHTGVDYAAPAGTPVVSIGDGTVIAVGYKGAGGNTVKIRHNSVYTTAYMHLKGYAKGVKTGARVRQGQTIGYVGSTGRSTGPHLDFRVWKNGSPINPLKMQSPPAEPVRTDLRPQFEAQKSRLDSLMLSYN